MAFEWLTQGLAALGNRIQKDPLDAIIPIAGAFANRGEKTTAGPNLSPQMQKLHDDIIAQMTGLYNPAALTGNAVSGINHTADIERQKLIENLAARGITGPAAENALAGVDSRRFAEITHAKQNLPLIQSQLLGNANSALLGGAGTTTASSGNKTGGAFNALAQYLATLRGLNTRIPRSTTTSTGTATPPVPPASNGVTASDPYTNLINTTFETLYPSLKFSRGGR